MTSVTVPDTSFCLSPEILEARKRKEDELEAYRASKREENIKKVESVVSGNRIKSLHETDPKQALWDKYKDTVKDIPIFGAGYLVAIYRRPAKTVGGIIRPDEYLKEDLYQGKVGLVLKVGPYPIEEEDKKWFGESVPKVGDWVVFRASNGISFGLHDKDGDCRFITDRRSIWMTINDPELVW